MMLEDKARELGRLIGQSPEYQAVKRASDALNGDREASTLLRQMEQLQLEAERLIERGELEALEPIGTLPGVPRYLVTYINSQIGGRIRAATVVTVTNQSERPNLVTVPYFKGFSDNTSPVGATSPRVPDPPSDRRQSGAVGGCRGWSLSMSTRGCWTGGRSTCHVRATSG